MKKTKNPQSLRSRLVTALLLCWVLPVLSVVVLAGWLLSTGYERSARQELESRAENAMEQLEMRLEAVFEASKEISYDGVVRNSYRLYQKDGDSAALYRAVSDNLNMHFARNELVPAAFLSFWEAGDVRPYAANRADFGYQVQREYRETIEQDLLEKCRDLDTGILLLEYGGELYVARNLLDGHFRPYCTIVLLCDRESLFRSLDPIREGNQPLLVLDGSLTLRPDGTLRAVSADAPAPEEGEGFVVREREVSGHSLRLTASIAPFNFWRDVPQIRTAAGLVVLLVIPLLLTVLPLFRRHVTRPVETLVEASERISGGERGYTITEEAHSREFESLYEHFNAMSLELKDQFERSYQEQQALQQARIKALQLQINPHFLNNTLEIINWEARLAGDDRVSAMIEALSVMMDGALGRDGRSRISLREELSYVDAYLYIIRERLGERLEVVKEIEEEMLEVPVPRLILQPLAENAVEHDITPNRGGKLCIRACREGGRAALEVEHSGRLSEEDRKAAEAMLSSDVSDTEISGQIGLRNVRQRLKLLYGEEGSLSLSEPGPDRILARAVFPAES